MHCTCTTNPPNLDINRMKDGDMAEVIQWDSGRGPMGQVVMRHDNRLIILGKHSGACRSSFFESHHNDIRVRLIQPGECIQVNPE